jgi:SAM-dependent methyltransferase
VGRRYDIAKVLDVYQGHPLSCASILERIRRHRTVALPISELDLAVDFAELVSDQNHIGGALSTFRLAARAGITPADIVLDLGCGLGGPMRLIAEVYGCRAHGLDANPARIKDARELSEVTALQDLVSFAQADFLEVPLQPEFTVVWAQNSWIHIDEPRQLASIAVSALRPGGRLAFEDVWLRRVPASGEEGLLLDDLYDSWRSSFSPLEHWLSAFKAAGLDVLVCEDDTEMLLRHYEAMTALASATPDAYPAHEIVGWRSALSLARAGVVGYGRVVSTLRGAM